jgi:hypothetical protein
VRNLRHLAFAKGAAWVVGWVLHLGCVPGVIGDPRGGAPATGGPPPSVIDQGPIDPGSKVPHRLNNREYDRTLADLLGVTVRPGRGFLGQEDLGFDTIADGVTMTTVQVEAYLFASEAVIDEVFATPALLARLLTCPNLDDPSCLTQIIEGFGRRAWRRPLAPSETAALLAHHQEAQGLGESPRDALAQVFRTMLVSPAFLYRLELDPDPESITPRPLDGFELASRLSYFLWSTMPDDTLLALAESGDLLLPEVLAAEVERMLSSEKAQALVGGFSRQWLGSRQLIGHQVLPEVHPGWDEELRAGMLAESDAYFAEFLAGRRPVAEFLQANLHFVTPRLARHYGLPEGGALERIEAPLPERRGYLGLAGFLTMSSFAHRTSPTLRAKQVLGTFLCFEPPPPPPNVAINDLDQGPDPASLANVRVRLEQHRRDPQCAGCHSVMDPFGLGLEAFDAVGQHRQNYSNGDAIDARGELPDGRRFDGLLELSQVITEDPRFLPCVTEKLYTYGLGRRLSADDHRAIAQITTEWARGGSGDLPGLLRGITSSPSFRERRGSIEGVRR